MQKPRIVQAADAVAYLPLYVAEQSTIALDYPDGELNWENAFDPPFRSPPDEFLTGIVGESRRTGDQGCLNAIRNAWSSKTPLIGICDPCNIVDFQDLVMVGGFINRACFWCLADVNVPDASRPEKLEVSHLFVHERGFLTGHRIGEDVIRRLPKDRHGQAEIVTGTFELLIDGAIWQKAQEPQSKVAAISASILSCVLAEGRGFRIAFPLHSLPNYGDFLTTAIVVHREALKHRDVRRAVALLLRSLSVTQVHAGMMGYTVNELCRLCNVEGRFQSERKIDCAQVLNRAVVPKEGAATAPLPDVSQQQAKAVWRALQHLYSGDCDISETAWSNALKLRENGSGAGKHKLSDFFDRSIFEEAWAAKLVGEREAEVMPFSSFLPIRSRQDGVRLILFAIFWVVAGYLLNQVPPPIRLSAFVVVVVLIFRLIAFRSDFLRRIVDGLVVLVWWLLIFALSATILVAFVAGVTKEGDSFRDLSDILGTAFNSHWQSWAPRISNTWEVTSLFFTAMIGLVTGVMRISRAARLLPRWVQRLVGVS